MNLVCPVCGAEYLGWVTKCSDCGIAVVPPAEAPNPLELPEEEQVVYELDEWSLDMQADAAAAMAESGIPHAFDGSDLVVHLDYEPDVDHILDLVEHGHDVARLADAERSGDVVYELDEWDDESRDELQRRLDEGGVPYRLEGNSFVVDASDEQAADFLIAEVRGVEADVDEPIADESDPELLSRIFLTADRIHDKPGDADAIVDLVELSDDLDEDVPPFGVAPQAWERIVDRVDALADALGDEGGPDETSATAIAAELRTMLKPFV